VAVTTGAAGGQPADKYEYPRGLIAPARRGRSERLIGDVIVDLGFVGRRTVDDAVKMAHEQGKPTGQVLVESGALRPDQLARALAERFGVEYVDLSMFEIDMGAFNLVDIEVAKDHRAVPIGFLADGSLLLAMADPGNVLTTDEISMITGRKVRPAAAGAEDVAAVLARLNRLEGSLIEVPENDPELDLAPLAESNDDAPIVKLVYSLIAQAVEQGASDIHCDPERGEMRVHFRIDGVLTQAALISRSMGPSVISRIKIMSGINIAERRVSQDGRMTVEVDGRRVDVRVVTLPLVKGEGCVMRILDSSSVIRDLESLGMRDEELARFLSSITRPYGAVLVTGPTGSGKSTTLYAALGKINAGVRSIFTIEDPVESPIAGIKQMQVSPKAGVTFAGGLRSMLRADPDVIMVGEIRDRETAQIAVQAAMTGHLVLSTLHTRDAAGALTRLVDMGIDPFMIAAAIDCVVAQRLARVLCEQCKQPTDAPAAMRREHGLQGIELFEPVGCIRCGCTGFRGRIGLYEVMPMTDEIRSLVLTRSGVEEIAARAAGTGMQSMRQDGIEKVKLGLTTLTEVARVTAAL